MTAPNIPAALARLAADMEKLADLVRRCGGKPSLVERVELAGEGGEIWERAQDELTHNRVAALVAEVIAGRELLELQRMEALRGEAMRSSMNAVFTLRAARAATDKAFRG
jgi:hypothetical protein